MLWSKPTLNECFGPFWSGLIIGEHMGSSSSVVQGLIWYFNASANWWGIRYSIMYNLDNWIKSYTENNASDANGRCVGAASRISTWCTMVINARRPPRKRKTIWMRAAWPYAARMRSVAFRWGGGGEILSKSRDSWWSLDKLWEAGLLRIRGRKRAVEL